VPLLIGSVPFRRRPLPKVESRRQRTTAVDSKSPNESAMCLVSRYRSRPIVIDGADLRFALTRWWSGGDSNRRSSLKFPPWKRAQASPLHGH
jgi:hypothetical protein